MITFARPRRLTTVVALILLSMMLLASLPGTPTAMAADTGNLYVKVFYKAGDGSRQPLPGVAVRVAGDASEWIACTNQLGIARFKGVAAGVDLTISTEIRHQPDPFCENLEFLNPDTGQKMLKASAGPIQVAAGGQERVRMTMATPRRQNLVCGGLWATWVGTQGPDTYWGTSGIDVIVGLGGNDFLDGGEGDDHICGGRGKDRLGGGDIPWVGPDFGVDLLWGEADSDELFGAAGDDWLFGGAGPDWMCGDTPNDLRDFGDDHLFGQDGRDSLVGGPGDDYLFGQNGQDWFSGGEGTDYCDWEYPEYKRGCEIIPTPAP